MQVTSDNSTETSTHNFTTCASDINLRPGEWPVLLSTKLGNGLEFQRASKKVDAEGDILWVTYRQIAGCIKLQIYND